MLLISAPCVLGRSRAPHQILNPYTWPWNLKWCCAYQILFKAYMTFFLLWEHEKRCFILLLYYLCVTGMFIHISDQHWFLHTNGAAFGFCGGASAETERGLFYSSPEAIQLLTAVRDATAHNISDHICNHTFSLTTITLNEQYFSKALKPFIHSTVFM